MANHDHESPNWCPYCGTPTVPTDDPKFLAGIRPEGQHEAGCEFCNPIEDKEEK